MQITYRVAWHTAKGKRYKDFADRAEALAWRDAKRAEGSGASIHRKTRS